ncbi:acetyltransferase, ribosomal protein N-acetylase [Arthrobacter crystallopoietes BAB-32]|uniref:Lysine N-acyltransferase MbtK n=1 Tax=Arthrobacter crystallopoietes BAB-32 TaxID=1246476 RepID=N1V7P1_9MICC|nr:GNAT family N-acetyltransferase [Arthrobacter crystallopoietes]EMY34253.1 acetyltransferase, ribosomal protein N-acetylase [Arthrobacter crystallopoietes BAB-32]
MTFTFTPADPQAHAALLHGWVTREYARFWGMLGATEEQVRAELAGIAAHPHHEAWMGYDGGVPAFLMERYLPGHSPLAGRYPVRQGDVGMHLLVGPPDVPRAGFTADVFDSVMRFLFRAPGVRRVVVEPDIRNSKILALNERFGFRRAQLIKLPDKQAWLSFCTREDFARATEGVPA